VRKGIVVDPLLDDASRLRRSARRAAGLIGSSG